MRPEGPIVAENAAERIERAVLRAAMTLPRAVRQRLAGPPLRRDGLTLDSDTQLLLRLASRRPDPPLRTVTTAHARAKIRHSVYMVSAPPEPVAELRELTLDAQRARLRARLYLPHEAPPGPLALIVYYHGGGWVVGDLETHDEVCRLLGRAAGAAVLSVDYRLAPEHRFPAAVDDALASFREAVARAHELGCDPTRVAVAGDSAGGHLAAVTAQLARSDPQPPAFQLLIYPVTDCVEVSASRREFAEGFLLTKDNMDFYEQSFFGAAERLDPRVSPLRAEELEGVAPAMVVTAGFDPLRDEGEAYARRLHEAGVPTILRRHEGFIHGFAHAMIGGAGSREALAAMGGVLRVALAESRVPAL